MKKIFVLAIALGSISSVALAQEPVKADAGQPQKLTEAQMDAVAGGAPLINVQVIDVADVNDVNVAIPVNANLPIAVLGRATGAAAQAPGRQR